MDPEVTRALLAQIGTMETELRARVNPMATAEALLVLCRVLIAIHDDPALQLMPDGTLRRV